ncbi:MAG: hypothetical protein ABIR28_12230, partial [Vicinamibacteria bacterium]
GFRSFSSLLEDAQRRGVVTLRRDQKSGSYIVEDLGAATRGEGLILPARLVDTDTTAQVAAAAGNNDQGSNGSGLANPSVTVASAPASSSSNGAANGHSNGHRNETRDRDRDRRPSMAPAPTASSSPSTPSTASSTGIAAPSPNAPSVVVTANSTVSEDGSIAGDNDGPDGDAPTRPRRRRGGRGRGRNRDGRPNGEREQRPDLEARAEELPLPLPVDEDSDPLIPTSPEAAAAYSEMLKRATTTEAPVFSKPAESWGIWGAESTKVETRPTPEPAPKPEPERIVESVSVIEPRPEQIKVVTPRVEASAPTTVETPAIPPIPKVPRVPEVKPASPVAAVDPSKASFSLLGWLKGGG